METARLILLVLHILGFAALIIPTLFGDLVVPQSFKTPLSGIRFELDPVVFDGNYLMIVGFAVAACAALGLFLRRTRYGIGLRAAAENGQVVVSSLRDGFCRASFDVRDDRSVPG